MLIRPTLVGSLLLTTLVACGTSEPTLAPPLSAETERPGHTTRVMRASIDMAVSGDATLNLTDQEAKLSIVEILGGDNPVNIWFLSISPAQPVDLPDGRLLLFSADLSPGLYRGPGTYQLSEGSGTTIGGVAGPGSGAYVQLFRTGPQPEVTRFDRFGEPCRLEVTKELRTGRVRCPSLLAEDDGEISLSWTWTLATAED